MLRGQRLTHPLTIVEAFQIVARSEPGRVALESGPVSVTYAELQNWSNRFANRISSLGVRHGDIVATLTNRSIESIVAWLSILKLGAAYLPIDPQLPSQMASDILEDAAPSLILAERLLIPPQSQTKMCVLEDELTASSTESLQAPAPSIKTTDLAYVMFTSGSTGRSKGVMVPHRAVLRLVISPDYIELSEKTAFLQLAPLAFDACTLEIWGSLLNGGRLAIFPDAIPDLRKIGEALRYYKVNTLWLTAGLFHLMIEHHRDALKGLKQLLAGGDVLSPEHVRRALTTLPECQIINGYGPTENTTFTCCYKIPHDFRADESVPIGFPIRGTTVHVLDDSMAPVPDGVPGQLCTGGAGVALGYLNRPELTAEKFVRDPFESSPDAKLYLTGDMALRRPDGSLIFCGRRDRQVKIDGKRVELDEIEFALRASPQVADAAAGVHVTNGNRKQLIAFLKPTHNSQLPADELLELVKSTLKTRFPAYMIPTHMKVFKEFPLTANGKLDREKLMSLISARTEELMGSSKTELRETVLNVWRSILGRPEIPEDRNFFELGATSLMIVQAHADLEELLGRKFSVTDMFNHPTVADLITNLQEPAPRTGVSFNHKAMFQKRILANRRAGSRSEDPDV